MALLHFCLLFYLDFQGVYIWIFITFYLRKKKKKKCGIVQLPTKNFYITSLFTILELIDFLAAGKYCCRSNSRLDSNNIIRNKIGVKVQSAIVTCPCIGRLYSHTKSLSITPCDQN